MSAADWKYFHFLVYFFGLQLFYAEIFSHRFVLLFLSRMLSISLCYGLGLSLRSQQGRVCLLFHLIFVDGKSLTWTVFVFLLDAFPELLRVILDGPEIF